KNQFGRKLVLRKNSRFSSIFFWFFPALLKTIGNSKNDLPNELTRFILLQETTPIN
ncbi:Uncharacterized protein FWK35_00008501, partial [Aphis craccivora]